MPPRRATSRPKLQGPETLEIGRFKIQVHRPPPIDPRRHPAATRGPRQGILDRQLHVRGTQLGDHRTIHKFYHGMHDRLRVNHHVDLLAGKIEQPAGFDDLQGLVHEGGRIDGNFRPHVPSGVGQGLGDRDLGQVARSCGYETAPRWR